MVDLAKTRTQTIQTIPDARENNARVAYFGTLQRGPLLAARATLEREKQLRRIYWHDYNWMVQGAFAGLLKRVASTPWEIKGPDDVAGKTLDFYAKQLTLIGASSSSDSAFRSDIEYWQQILRLAHFGAGWTRFIKMGVDYLRQDLGWVWEIIAPGDPMSAPTGPATGIAHLDSLRCVPTGDPDYPIVYFDRANKPHLLHRSRVLQLVDMPDGDEQRPGYGLCALSRAAAISAREVLMGRYIESRLDDKPAPGIVKTNMVKGERERALALYKDDQTTDEKPPWGKQIWFFSPDPAHELQFEVQSFSEAPEKWDFKVYTEIDVDALALAIGVDRQDLWQLTGGNLGSGTQSEVLHAKSKGKAYGDFLTSLERGINDILPEEYEYASKWRDEQEDLQRAQIAESWANTVNITGARLSDDEARTILANQIEAVQDAITDEGGHIRRVSDVDVEGEQIATDSTQIATLGAAAANGAAVATLGEAKALPATLSVQPAQQPVAGQRNAAVGAKVLSTAEQGFTADLADAIASAQNDEMGRRRLGIVMRSLIRRYSAAAYRDGLIDGGVEDGDLDDEDLFNVANHVAAQSGFVTSFADALFNGEAVTPESRAASWYSKSIYPMYLAGLQSADENGMYEWELGQTEEHCKDCLRLAGQRHRFKDWLQGDILPKSEALECQGFFCDCNLKRTKGRARGTF